MKRLYKNVPVLDSGARGSTTTFVEREIGDVLIAWENEAFLSVKELGPDKVQIVVPSQSILAEPPVSIVDNVVDKNGTRAVAEAYLQYLYTPEGQEIAARNFYRPRLDSVAKKYASTFPKIKLFTLADVVGDWQKTQKRTLPMEAYSIRSTSRISRRMTFTLQKTQHSAGLRSVAGLHDLLFVPDCADSAGRDVSESVIADLGAVLARCGIPARWLPIGLPSARR